MVNKTILLMKSKVSNVTYKVKNNDCNEDNINNNLLVSGSLISEKSVISYAAGLGHNNISKNTNNCKATVNRVSAIGNVAPQEAYEKRLAIRNPSQIVYAKSTSKKDYKKFSMSKKLVYPESKDFVELPVRTSVSRLKVENRSRSSSLKENSEKNFYKSFLPRNGIDPAQNTQSKWKIFTIALSVAYSYILNGPPRKEWSFLYTVAVLTTKRILEQITADPEPAVLELQRRQVSTAAKIPRSAKLSFEYFKTNVKAIEFFREKSPGEWPKFAKNIGPIYGEFIAATQADDTSVILSLHGGMHVTGSAQIYRAVNYNLSQASGSVVFAINYRLAPLNPYPCGMIDTLTAYLFLIEEKGIDPNRIILSGDSAGAGMAIALATVIRDMGLPSPGGVYVMSPWVDLTHSQESYYRNNNTDGIPNSPPSDPRLGERMHYYTENKYLKDGYVSPFFQTNLQKLPPIFIQCGSAEKLCDEAVVFAEKVSRADGGNSIVLEVYQAHVHCFQLMSWFRGPKNAMNRAGVWIHNLLHGITPEENAHVFLDFKGVEYGRTPLLKADRLSLVLPHLPTQRSIFRNNSSFASHQHEASVNFSLSANNSIRSFKAPPTIKKTFTITTRRETSLLFQEDSVVDPVKEIEAQSYSQPLGAIIQE